MKLKIENLIKYNKYFYRLYIKIFPFLFRSLSQIIRRKKIIVYSSFQGRSVDDSPYNIFLNLKNDKRFADYTHIWAVRVPELYPHLTTVKLDSFRYFYLILSAKVWVTNVNIERGLNFKPNDTVYVSTWHGTPIKKIGQDVGFRSDCDWSYVDIATVTGDYEAEIFASCFDLDHLKTRVFIGNPRHDYVNRQSRTKLHEILNINAEKDIILFAPSWRDYEQKDNNADYTNAVLHMLVRNIPKNAVLVFKPHIITSSYFSHETFKQYTKIWDNSIDITEFYSQFDLLITDFSGIAFDFSFSEKPIISVILDEIRYQDIRGFYQDLEFYFGHWIARSEVELIDLLCRYKDQFCDDPPLRHLISFNNHVTDQVSECIAELVHE